MYKHNDEGKSYTVLCESLRVLQRNVQYKDMGQHAIFFTDIFTIDP